MYSARLPPFFELDVRVEKRWRILKDSQLSVYLDVLDATNYRNVEALTYNYDYQIHATAAGLPIIPSLGIKVEL